MKILIAALILLLVGLQYRLWFGEGSVQEHARLQRELGKVSAELLETRNRNRALTAEVEDLKSGLDAIEERARAELDMVGEGETFYQFVRERRHATRRNDAEAVRTRIIKPLPSPVSE